MGSTNFAGKVGLGTPMGISVSRSDLNFVSLARAVTTRILAPHLDIRHVDVPVKHLPLPLHGFRIGHVSDFHVGPGTWRPFHEEQAARAVANFSPDLIVNTGDFIYKNPESEPVIELVSRFVSVDTPHVSILGNHDYLVPAERRTKLRKRLQGLGIHVLENQTIQIGEGDRAVTVAGLDFNSSTSTVEQGLRALLRSNRPRVLLVHEPDLVLRVEPGAADLVLSGHTHGGQIAVPGLTPWIVRRFPKSTFVQGSYQINDMPLYVNRGLGCVGAPIRFRAPPEVTLIRLVR